VQGVQQNTQAGAQGNRQNRKDGGQGSRQDRRTRERSNAKAVSKAAK
jgi:hypothetical protein